MTQTQIKNSIETVSYKMSLKKTGPSNDSTSSSDSDDGSDSSSSTSSSSSSEASIDQTEQSSVTKFSILNNDTDSGLRMKITTIPKPASGKSDSSTIDTNANQKSLNTSDSIASKEAAGGRKSTARNMMSKKQRQDSTSNSSCCSDCTESEDDSDSSSICSKNKNASKSSKQNAANKLPNKNNSNFQRRNAAAAKRNSNQPKANISSDSDSSDESSDCKPVEKRSSPTKPKSPYKNDFFHSKTMVHIQHLQVDGGASSSDMELPALVSAAIQRVESCSEEENAKGEQNNKTQYTSSLLRDFVAKTQMMGSSFSSSNHIAMSKDDQKQSVDGKNDQKNDNSHNNADDTTVKRKRGRPRKNPAVTTNQTVAAVHNGSPDSGITSTPQSPNPSGKSGSTKTNKKSSTVVAKKIDISTLEKSIYANERVLYPPRRKRQLTMEAQQQHQHSDSHSRNHDNHQGMERVDPAWRQIDINKKFRRPSGYRSDTNTICSKVLAAQSGYTSDYCNVNRHLFSGSGYKSDYSCKSRRSGYKSDYSVKAKSCGYRSDCSTRHRRKIRRKRRTKMASTKPTINDQDILMLAGLSLGHSDESSYDSGDKPQIMSKPSSTPRNNSISNNLTKKSATTKVPAQKSLGDDCFSTNGSDRTPKHKSSSNFESLLLSMNGPLRTITSSIYKDGGDSNSIKLDRMKPGMIRRRRSSAVSHCSSHCSTSSRHPFRRRRRRRLKSITDQSSEPNLAKMNQQIDVLTSSFTSMCSIFSDKSVRDKEKISQPPAKPVSSRRTGKKRKTNQEISEVPTTNATTTSKRRNKKAVQTKSPDDHKLPLKKRHYLLTPGEKSDSANAEEKDDAQNEADNETDISGTAVTPKKRHLLQTPVDLNDVVDSTDATSNSSKDLPDIHASTNAAVAAAAEAAPTKTVQQSKKIEPTRKKGKVDTSLPKTIPNVPIITEPIAKPMPTPAPKTPAPRTKAAVKAVAKNLATKSSPPPKTITTKAKQPANPNTQPIEPSTNAKTSNSRLNSARNSSKIEDTPPPGVFEPSIDFEQHIPLNEIQRSNAEMTVRIDTAKNKTPKLNVSKTTSNEGVIEKLLHRTNAVAKLGKKKRKKPNRTGFPTLKKKKKPMAAAKAVDADQSEPLNAMNTSKMFTSEPKIILECVEDLVLQRMKVTCDRVPSEGETTGTFMERNVKSAALTVSVERLPAKMLKAKGAAKKSKTTSPPKVVQKQDESKQKSEDKPKEINLKQDAEKLTQKENDSKHKLKSKEIPVESEPPRSPSRRGRTSVQKENDDSAVPAKSQKLSKPSVTKVKESPANVEAIVPKQTERSSNIKQIKKDISAPTKSNDKKQSTKEDKKKSTELPKPEKSAKRTVNGRIIASNDRKLASPIASSKSENMQEQRGRKKQRCEKASESKSDSHKRVRSPSIPTEVSVVEKKRARIEKTETAKSPNTKEKSKSKQKVLTQETVTDIDDIIPVDDWIEQMDQEPLPLEENIHFDESTEQQMVQPSNDTKKPSAKPKKKYLVAGLFSNYFKSDVQLPAEKSSKNSAHKSSENETTGGSLLPMPYLDKYVFTQIDFCLPYDLWYAHENDKLSGRNVVHSWNFKKIRTNVYSDSVKPIQSPDLPQCSCKPEYECGDNCLNRLVYTECNPETCPCGDKCRNTKIQKHIVAPVERFMTQNKGWGVKSNKPIKKGTYILEYVGEVVNEREFKERMGTYYKDDIHHYCLHLDGGLVIDGHRMGSDCRFVNHSCEPNCEMQKWSVNGLSRMALFAMRDIQPGEELTYDYNFALFNPHEGQVCKCESKNCRGVIGGKSQRVRPIENTNGDIAVEKKKGRSKRLKHGGASKSKGFMHSKDHSRRSHFQLPGPKEQMLIITGHCFLLRNLKKIRNANLKTSSTQANLPNTQVSLAAKISALRVPRNIRTRGVTNAEHDPVIEKTVRIAVILREICDELNNFKDASGQYAISKLNLPSKKKNPQYYEKIKQPIDLSTIESNVEKGVYDRPTLFDADVNRLFANAIEYYGNGSPEATITMQLQTVYTRKKADLYDKLVAICGESAELSALLEPQHGPFLCPAENPNEDHIRCICGLFRDEGIMIQCSQCKIWQHAECTGADTRADDYFCEKCAPRNVDYEIPLKDKTEEGYQYYLSLMRGNDLQIRQSDTVYVLRDIPIEEGDTTSNGDKAKIRKHTYETIGDVDYNECDIFRVERMWKDHSGRRFIYGHHYLRPHETYHEPTRKFYQNEVVRVPLYEVVPIELIMGRCWVMDLNTFCKGRPTDSIESHVYICELRVDRAARLFSKVSKNPYPVCQKSYAFKRFRQRLKITRSYLPHEVNMSAVKIAPKKRRNPDEISNLSSKKQALMPIVQLKPPPQQTLNEKRTRLEKYLSHLMEKQRAMNDGIQPLDLSYLLTGRGARRRTTATNVPHLN